MTKSLYLLLLAAGTFAFSSCNTFIGLGRDVQSLGSGMQNTGHGKSWSADSATQTPAITAPMTPVVPAAPSN